VSATDELTRVRDTCNVWVIRRGREAICIDFGTGAVLDQLAELGIDRITDVLVTHFHRDGVQGLNRAAEAGTRIWVPPVEQDLFTRAGELWAGRRVENDYDLLQARSLNLDAERRRERVLRMRFPLPFSFFGRKSAVVTDAEEEDDGDQTEAQ